MQYMTRFEKWSGDGKAKIISAHRKLFANCDTHNKLEAEYLFLDTN